MSTFRILNQRPVFFGRTGNYAGLPLAGGSLSFYATGTTTPKDVYSDASKTANNGATVALDSSGQSSVDVWGDGAYRVRLYDADGVLQSEADDVEIPGGTGTTIPTLSADKFLTNDGAVLSWSAISQVPDPTGSAGKILGNDGANFIWQDAPVAPTAPITTASDSVKWGNTASVAAEMQWGSSTAPASGTYTAQKAITFATPFATVPAVSITAIGAGTGGPYVAYLGSTPTVNGFTAVFDIAEGNSANAYITNDVQFQWVAVGTVAA